MEAEVRDAERRSSATTAWVVDVLVAAGAAAAAVGALGSADEAGADAPDVLAVTLLVVASSALLARRRWPLASTAAAVATTWTYLALGYPGGAELPVLLVAFFSVAAAGHRWPTVAVVALVGGGGLAHRLVVEGEGLLQISLTVTLLVLASLLGDSVSTRRRLRAEVRERLRAAEVEKELEAQARVTGERLRIAHELHDVIAHTITTMTVQAGAAADLLDERPDDARRALHTLRAAARDATAQLRATLTILRGDEDRTRRSAPGLAQLPDLVDRVRDAGVAVDLRLHGVTRPLSAAVELTVFRIVQEGLTNVIRHAPDARAAVAVRSTPTSVAVRVVDDGGGRAAGPSPTPGGHGLLGLTERVHALGGALHAAPRADGGFAHEATLPAPGTDGAVANDPVREVVG